MPHVDVLLFATLKERMHRPTSFDVDPARGRDRGRPAPRAARSLPAGS